MELTLPNRISIFRILLIPPFIFFMFQASHPELGRMMRYLALAVFVIMGISDFLDGYIARLRKEESNLGAFLDPLADKLLMLCSCLIFYAEPTSIENFRLPIAVVLIIIGKDIFLALGFFNMYLMVTDYVKIKPVMIGKAATVLQLATIIAILTAPEMFSFWSWWWYLPRLLWWSSAATALITVLLYIHAGSKYLKPKQ